MDFDRSTRSRSRSAGFRSRGVFIGRDLDCAGAFPMMEMGKYCPLDGGWTDPMARIHVKATASFSFLCI